MKNIRELVIKNRSCRSFDRSVKITEEDILRWLDTTRFTMSSSNLQPLKYYYSVNDEINEKIRPHTYWARLLPEYNGPDDLHNPVAYIVICVDKEIIKGADPNRFSRDVGIVAQTIMLQATEDGFSGCMIGNFDNGLYDILPIPENCSIALVLALGKCDEEIVLTEAENGKTAYYRENGKHFVPKRNLDEIIIK